jgi:hypothetical protein
MLYSNRMVANGAAGGDGPAALGLSERSPGGQMAVSGNSRLRAYLAREPGSRLLAELCQSPPFMHRDVIRLVAFDLVLRLVFAGVVDIPFEIHVPNMNLDDPAADMPRLGIPGDVIADLEAPAHLFFAAPWRESATDASLVKTRNVNVSCR